MRTCDIEGCDKKHLAKGLCYDHYFAAKKNQVTSEDKEEPMATKLSPLDEVRADAKYNYMKRLNQQQQDQEYEASKKEQITPEASASDKKGNKE